MYIIMKRVCIKALMLMLWAMLGIQGMQATQYFGTPYKVTQPDGSIVPVRLFGSELYVDAESIDGYTLIKDAETGYVCYASLALNGTEYASTGIVYKGTEAPDAVKMITEAGIRISSESIKAKQNETATLIGANHKDEVPALRSSDVLPDTIYGVCLMIDFPDQKFSFTTAEIDTFLNADHGSINGNTRSIKEYFRWISGGKLTYINYLPLEPFTAPNVKEFYSPSSATTYTIDRFMPVVEDALLACTKEKDGFDVTDLTTRNGVIMAINIFYAGECTNNWATGLWPHQSSYKFKKIVAGNLHPRAWHKYQISNLSTDIQMGTFVHENRHMILGMPDYYSYDGHNDNNASTYNIGDSFFTAIEKDADFPNPYALDQLGWLDNKVVLNDIMDGREIELNYGVGNAAVYYGSGLNAKERYYLEVRTLNYNRNTPKGIFVWHVNEAGNNLYAGSPEMLDCRPATKNDPFWSALSKENVFDDDAEASAKWYDGSASGLSVYDFSKPDWTMTFRCGGEIIEEPLVVNMDEEVIGVTNSLIYALMNVTGGDGKYNIEIEGNVPEWLNITEEGELLGTPNDAFAGYDEWLKLVVSDASGNEVEKLFRLIVFGNVITPFNLVRFGDELINLDSEEYLMSEVETVINDKFEVYPNPSYNEFTVETKDASKAFVISLDGKVIETVDVEGKTKFGAELKAGTYLLNVNGETKKIVKM